MQSIKVERRKKIDAAVSSTDLRWTGSGRSATAEAAVTTGVSNL